MSRTAAKVEEATRRSVQAAQLDPRDVGASEALLALAWALDAAREAGKFYGVPRDLPELADLPGAALDALAAVDAARWAR